MTTAQGASQSAAIDLLIRAPGSEADEQPQSAWQAGIHPLAEILGGLARFVSGARVRWEGCHRDARQRIYFANHSSHMDFVLLWATLPRQLRRQTRPVAAKDYWHATKVRRSFISNVFHVVLIERGSSSYLRCRHSDQSPEAVAIQPLVEALDHGQSLILFPEGTRGNGIDIAPFGSGLYHLSCKRPDIELVPVYLANLGRILPKGEFLPVPAPSSITFGPPIYLEEGEDRHEFLQRARRHLSSLRDL